MKRTDIQTKRNGLTTLLDSPHNEVLFLSSKNVGTLNSSGDLSTNAFRGKDIEGSVYGAVYLHLSRLIGLHEVVGLVINSKATTFDNLKFMCYYMVLLK